MSVLAQLVSLVCGIVGIFERLEGPELPHVVGDLFALDANWSGALWPGCAHLDPFGEGCDLFGGELTAALRHLQGAGLMDRFDQEALVGIAENDGRT